MLPLTIALTGLGITGMLFACYMQLRDIADQISQRGQAERHHHESMQELQCMVASLRQCETDLNQISYNTRS